MKAPSVHWKLWMLTRRAPIVIHDLTRLINRQFRVMRKRDWFYIFILLLLLFVWLWLTLNRKDVDELQMSKEQRQETCFRFRKDMLLKNAVEKSENETVSSVIMMLYTDTNTSEYHFEQSESTNKNERYKRIYSKNTQCVHDALADNFARLASVYVTDPHDTTTVNPYYNFFRAHDVSLWTIDLNTHVATPLQLDVVYTYVNPSAPSFARHAKQRKVSTDPTRRYFDWEELRYSLRALQTYALDSEALRQYHNKYAEDVELLKSLGFRVKQNTTTNINIDNIDSSGVSTINVSRGATDNNTDDSRVNKFDESIIRRIYLVLSDVDQIPDWLNVTELAMLRVVTHSELFTRDNESFILPTLNSNAIESGLHRIPDLSRFYVYFANDMLLGRKLSLFDLFRMLSPQRQLLHVANLFEHTSSEGDNTFDQWKQILCNATRTFTFLEPLGGSETLEQSWEHIAKPIYADKTRRRTRLEVQTCLKAHETEVLLNIKQSSTEHSVDFINAITNLGWRTTNIFALQFHGSNRVRRGYGVDESYYHYLMTTRLNGLIPPYGYAHRPIIFDKHAVHQMLEVDLFDLANATRAAYEREMYPFSMVDFYTAMTTAYARMHTFDMWRNFITSTSPLALEEKANLHSLLLLHEQDQEQTWLYRRQKLSKALVSYFAKRPPPDLQIADLGPLYGDSYNVVLQSPELFTELAFWWSPELRPTHTKRRSLQKLKEVYHIPRLKVITNSITLNEHTNVHKGNDQVEKRNARWLKQASDNYYNLLHDLRHYVSYDTTYRFIMLENVLKAGVMAARYYREPSSRQLWNTFNDNFPSHNGNISTTLLQEKGMFKVLMLILLPHNTKPAAWERNLSNGSS